MLDDSPRTLIHNDFNSRNIALRRTADGLRLCAFDWELATIGDPLTDLGLLLMFWGPRPIDPPAFHAIQQVTRAAGAPSRGELAERWSRATGIGIEALTDRELQVVHLVVDRRTNREIGAELFISQKTVETHLRNIFHKMKVSSRVELARAVEHADLLNPTVS